MTVEEVVREPFGFDPESLRNLRRRLIGASTDEPAFASAAVRIGKLVDTAPHSANGRGASEPL